MTLLFARAPRLRRTLAKLLFFSAAFLVSAGAQQKGGKNIVAGQIEERELAILDANNYLSEGDRLLEQGQLKEAVGQYLSAVDVLPTGEKAGGIRATALDRYAKSATKYAETLIVSGHKKEARTILEGVVGQDRAPSYEPAKKLLAAIADGDWVNPSLTPKHVGNVSEVNRLLREAATVLNQGKLDDASAKYSEVLTIDRYNTAAREGLARVAEYQRLSDEAAHDHTRAEMLSQLGSKWALGKPRRLGMGSRPVDQGTSSASAPQSEDIANKLRTIVIDVIDLHEVTLEQGLAFLVQRSREMDPTGKGVNIVLGNDTEIERSRLISLRLRQAPLLEALRYVTQAVNAQYLIEPGAVRVVGTTSKDDSLLTRRFSVAPDFFKTAGAAATPSAAPTPFDTAAAQPTSRRVSPQDFLQSNGIAFPEGASATYLVSTNQLIVRNTYANLQLVEQIVASAQQEEIKQVYVEVRMLDISERKLSEIGFDWLLGGFELNAKNDVLAGGGQVVSEEVAPNFVFRDPATGKALGGQRVTGGLRSGVDALGLDGLDQIINVDRSNEVAADVTGPGIFSINGRLTDPQFQAVLRGLSQHSGIDLVVEPKIVTKSGQRASIFVGQELLYPTEFDPPELPQQVATTGAGIPVTPAHPTTFRMRPIGFTLEVEPVIGPDNYTIDLSLRSEFTEFEGFVNYGSPITVSGTDALGQSLELLITRNEILQPVFKVRRLPSSNVSAYDGSTLVIGGLSDSRLDKILDKVPFLGDLPFVGSLFRSNLDRIRDRAVVFFLTTRIIDTSGAPFNARAQGEPVEKTALR